VRGDTKGTGVVELLLASQLRLDPPGASQHGEHDKGEDDYQEQGKKPPTQTAQATRAERTKGTKRAEWPSKASERSKSSHGVAPVSFFLILQPHSVILKREAPPVLPAPGAQAQVSGVEGKNLPLW